MSTPIGDQQGAADDVEDPDVALHPGDRVADPAEAEGDQQERDAEADAVGEAEQQRAPRVGAVAREEADRDEGRADARRPADREDDAEQRARRPGPCAAASVGLIVRCRKVTCPMKTRPTRMMSDPADRGSARPGTR